MGRRRCSLLVLLLAAFPCRALSHAQYQPFSLNRFLEVRCRPGGLLFDYTVTIGDVPAGQLRKRADDDGDGRLGPAEQKKLLDWITGVVARGLRLSLDGRRLPALPWSITAQWGDERVRVFSPLRLHLVAEQPCSPGNHLLLLHDTSRLPALEQSELLVHSTAPCPQVSAFLPGRGGAVAGPVFWNGGRQPDPVQVRFTLSATPPAGEDSAPGGSPLLDDSSGPLKRALAEQHLGFWGFLAILALAVGLGAAHALSPGHGKTLVAAYLVGSHGRTRHAVVLGLVVTMTHVFSVIVLGLVALWASEKVLAERLAPYVSLAAGLLVLLTGSWMLLTRLRGRHHHHPHGDDHHHHDHAHHAHAGPTAAGQVRWSELLALGISGGLVPCPSATVVLLFAIYVGQIGRGLLLICAFSLGLALTLVLLGLAVLQGSSLLGRLLGDGRLARLSGWLPVASAVVVLVIGLVMTLLTLPALLARG